MNRRSFLRRAFAVVAIANIAPASLLVADPPLKRICNTTGGVTTAQLQELIQMTLKDFPMKAFETAWTQLDFSFSDIYRSK